MKKLIASCTEFATGITDRRLFVYATSGSYYVFMALVPTVMIVLCTLPYTPLSEEVVLRYISVYFSKELAQIMSTIAAAIYDSNTATLTISILLTLFSASSAMRALMRGMDSAYGFHGKQNILFYNLRAIAYMIMLVLALFISLVILVYGKALFVFFTQYLPDFMVFDFIASGSRYVVILCLLILFFMMMYKLMTSEKVNFWKQMPGAIFCSFSWVIFSYLFNLYVNVSDKFGAYGVIGTVMVSMMWINYCFLFLLVGGYINSYFSKK